ncbi:MAG: SDR family NAD(P)-dependent oxidoreductase [Planctomycetales bacterium]|nr:SDR family NAD(P)-dependent oxidoreductase [Planctomycetales bacterium]NIM09328.1 SDR family NAD(P)-dependent oxidoreductase [Planctomycetales bacterium]NIN08799.1 SDR family NAD(P)-dependent oxidoreductase [Planctomycetales bacterium]NIN77916.1 SDR family NAD(P)-dependent oxidoreductase [Planctomycetales bacterium]NIO35099.1 SDR family NAD(P)-dependent oxidoreductase [Planctomycetales bacterium]
MQIAGHTFLITGGASGLGAACVRRLAGAGANVVAADIDDEKGASLAHECGPQVRFVQTDVTAADAVQAAVDVATNAFGALHGAVACAGILDAARLVGRQQVHPLDIFRRVLDVNLIGTFHTLRLAAQAIAAGPAEQDDERGVIVMTSSVAAWDGQIGQVAYAASKAAVAGMTLPAARELARFGIRVVSLAPGVFATGMMESLNEELRDSLLSQIPFPKRLGKPDEFAQLVIQAIENRMLNGSVLRLDGAIRMGPT